MTHSLFRPFVTALGCLATLTLAQASFTVGTFADPVANSSQNFFEFNRLSSNSATLEGAWLNDGLHLLTPGIVAPDQFNVRFEMRDAQESAVLVFTDAQSNGSYLSGPGYIRFFNASNLTVLRIDFDSALLTSSGVTAGFGAGTQAYMSGSIVEPGWDFEHFSFAFSNFNIINNNNFTMSSSFTSSAVPEPATVAALALGAAALLRRRKSS